MNNKRGISQDANVYRDELLATEANMIQMWQALGVDLEPLRTVHERAMQRIRELTSQPAVAGDAGAVVDLPPIAHDQDYDRDYIPLPGGWEIQTKGKGSTFRISDPQGERVAVTSERLHDPLTRMAHDIRAAYSRPQPTVPDDVMAAAGDVSFYCRAVEKDDAKLNVQLRKVLAFLKSLHPTHNAAPVVPDEVREAIEDNARIYPGDNSRTILGWLKSTNAAAAKDAT